MSGMVFGMLPGEPESARTMAGKAGDGIFLPKALLWAYTAPAPAPISWLWVPGIFRYRCRNFRLLPHQKPRRTGGNPEEARRTSSPFESMMIVWLLDVGNLTFQDL